MNQNSLLNILGILIGFAGIMLILSLLVTATTQAVLHFLHTRSKKLMKGLAQLFGLVVGETKGEKLANEILDTNSLMKDAKGGRTSWIDKKDFEHLLNDLFKKDPNIISKQNVEKVIEWFERMEKSVSQQFQLYVRKVTIICAIIIAVLFQVSAPDVLRQLARDPEYLAKAQNIAMANLDDYESDYADLLKYEDVSAAVLEQLQTNYPKLQTTLEEVSGVGDSKSDLVSELSLVLEDHPDKDDVLRNYEQLLDEKHQEGYNKAFETAQRLTGDLELIDITPLSKGLEFYWNIQNLLGIAMTAVLIGLGAPFWFNTLRDLVNLRDALSPAKSKKGKDQENQNR